MGFCIAIDGPAGAGKSTVARLVAEKTGLIYVDTGAMYRALAVHFLNMNLSPEDREGIVAACDEAEVTIKYREGLQEVYLSGENVTDRLRSEAVGNMASVSSALPQVRKKLLDLQRNMARDYPVVMDGRDIGTCVIPEANLKIFLTATAETRAKRRYDELILRGISADLKQIEADILSRDERDSSRDVAPLRQAEDAVLIDSSNMTIEEVTEKILELYRQRC